MVVPTNAPYLIHPTGEYPSETPGGFPIPSDLTRTVSHQKPSRRGRPSATFRLAEVGADVSANRLQNWKACWC